VQLALISNKIRAGRRRPHKASQITKEDLTVSLLDKILRAGEGRAVKELAKIAATVNQFESKISALTDDQLRNQTEIFKERIAKGETLDSLLPEAFATVREAAKRTLGQRHYDVQLMGGAALHRGNIAEMRTGEGKTLVSTLPAYLNALSGKGVHVVTVNDYLAERDSEWMGRVHRFLGLKVGVILASMTPAERRIAYQADITYGTNNEFGFDYLRDNMAWSLEDCVQREYNFAIVDEVDSILIDEARTPLIISGPADKATKWYVEFANIVNKLSKDQHYEVDEKKRTVGILEEGVTRVEEFLGIENLYESVNTPMIGYLNNAIRAKELFKRDKDYVVMNGELLIVDEHTGRMLAGRRYSEGLHQALEAKERIEIKDENQTLATITLQNYFRLYNKLGGMTGTAMTEASEFMQIYKLGVIPIPTNKSMQRIDQSDLIYKSEAGKFVAVAQDIVERHRKGQPVLVGTVSVEKSEELSAILKRNGVPHEVLNAKQHEREAAIIARAGVVGAVTVATNMAGRGTDIMLGGNPEFMADFELQRQGLNPAETPEKYEAAWPAEIAKQKAAVAKEHETVVALGGLYVLGTERHESRRIDNQLRGRSGRQGDPGESRFYLSLQDELMRRFNSGLVERFLTAAGMPEDSPLESKIVSNAIKSAQTQVESLNFEMRKNVLKYDDVMNKQREVIYSERREVLEGADIKDLVHTFLEETIEAYVSSATATGFAEDWDLNTLWVALKALYPISFTAEELAAEVGGINGLDSEFLLERVLADANAAYEKREADLTPTVMRELERKILLSVLDRKWREHLYEMDYLQEGIGLRAMAQRDPLVEYQREGYDLFAAMMDAIKEELVGFIFNVEVQVEGDQVGAKGLTPTPTPAPALKYSAAEVEPDEGGATSRNAPCPCGSGKKYKRCHGEK
jgi:preprotein translocase subunit SecA